ncbi:phytanoyl-CoA dioxygenase family protein [Mucilaginibacter robiniae]|uniref:Phytanoyl-CoA dioxygenase family protein n=1 Tax=Mucilaginibacter robiniae TaxID=2728022 RepID=A0A7L5E4K0_9SPHI|nr:phytanoyl-CoA dioxygenase family protein [Mucilaginibacter robiniae]QJD97995.1 phytanoyl-CoA dioxygenase family protein [Mucilaginibacter robiniae]
MVLTNHTHNIRDNGFTVIPDVFRDHEVNEMVSLIEQADTSDLTFRKTDDLFAIRQFLKQVPEIKTLIFTDMLRQILDALFSFNYFVVKSIYFDKPQKSNWFVAYHQDLTISVDRKVDLPDFGPWTIKQNQFAVQPPLAILKDNFTVRIHLDDTDEGNGALKVIPKSHHKGIYRPENINWDAEQEVICPVPRGGIMIMRPLLLHASNRTTSNRRRRVIHIEFSKALLPDGLQWSELESSY